MDRYETELRWIELFVGKHVDGREIVNIEAIGSPSFVYGNIKIVFEDGSSMFAPQGVDQYRPAIKNMKKIVDEYKAKND